MKETGLDNQLIVVMPDAAVDALEAAPNEEEGFLLKTVPELLGTMYYPLFGQAGKIVFQDAAKQISAYIKARKNGANIQTLRESVAKELRFPPGHPRQGVVYAQHPVNRRLYYTSASFHRMAFEHKFSEVIRLLTALGAREIKVRHGRGWSNEFGLELSISSEEASANGSAGKTSETNNRLLFNATLKGHAEPYLPDDLIWFEHEPTWQAIAEARRRHGLENFSLSLSYIDDYGVNAGLKVNAGNAGLELGGDFQEHEATVWHISGTFL